VFAAWTTAEHFARWFGGKDVQIPADRLDYEPTAGRAWSATMVLPDGNTIDWTGEPGRLAITVEFSPTASGTHMHLTQEAPDFTDERRTATIAGWQTFLAVLQQIAEAA
jgi:uncharacterized protein YndB with AHSA1/START domain